MKRRIVLQIYRNQKWQFENEHHLTSFYQYIPTFLDLNLKKMFRHYFSFKNQSKLPCNSLKQGFVYPLLCTRDFSHRRPFCLSFTSFPPPILKSYVNYFPAFYLNLSVTAFLLCKHKITYILVQGLMSSTFESEHHPT